MDKFSGVPSRAHMRLLYGPQVTEQELDAALPPFYKMRDCYRKRFQEHGIAISHEEAVKAYRLVAPLLSEPDPECAEQRAVMNAIMFPCSETGGFGIRIQAVRAIIEGFEREIDESSRVLYLKHDGETEAREASAWDRFVAYQALEFFVARIREYAGRLTIPSSPWIASVQLTCDQEIAERLSGEDRSNFERATAILAARTVNRPRGRYDARLNAPRDSIIAMFLHELRGCGLPVTSGSGASLASAMANALDISKAAIHDVWRDAERPDRRHRRCARCGEPAGEDARRDGAGDLVCLACSPN